MKGRSALALGSCLGSTISVLLLSIGTSDFQILLCSILSVFCLSCSTLLYCSVFGWPPVRTFEFDMYDFHRIAIGGALAAALVATFSAATHKLSFVLSIDIAGAAALSVLLFVLYVGLACSFFLLVATRKQAHITPKSHRLGWHH